MDLSDLESFAKSFKEVRARRGNEKKQAVYFETDCFRELDQLAYFLNGTWLERASKAISKVGCPVLCRK